MVFLDGIPGTHEAQKMGWKAHHRNRKNLTNYIRHGQPHNAPHTPKRDGISMASGTVGLKVNFTELVYAVVIGNSLNYITPDVPWPRLALYLFALVVIIDDWILYHLSADKIESTVRNQVACFLLDIAVLVIWYLLALHKEDQLAGFGFLLCLFYVSTSLWHILLQQVSPKRWLKETDIGLAATLFLIWFVLDKESTAFNVIAYVGMVGAFVGFRLQDWIALVKEREIKA